MEGTKAATLVLVQTRANSRQKYPTTRAQGPGVVERVRMSRKHVDVTCWGSQGPFWGMTVHLGGSAVAGFVFKEQGVWSVDSDRVVGTERWLRLEP